MLSEEYPIRGANINSSMVLLSIGTLLAMSTLSVESSLSLNSRLSSGIITSTCIGSQYVETMASYTSSRRQLQEALHSRHRRYVTASGSRKADKSDGRRTLYFQR
nr:hypothetical protein [Tanacetum cinerariifolium]